MIDAIDVRPAKTTRNAGLPIYSASLVPWFAGQSRWSRLALAIPVVDPLHFTCVPLSEHPVGRQHRLVGS